MSKRHEAYLARTVVLGALLTVSIVLWQVAGASCDDDLDVDGAALAMASDELAALPIWNAPRRAAPVASPGPAQPTGGAEPEPAFDLKDGEFVMIGRAVDEYGRPMPGAKVELEHCDPSAYHQGVFFTGFRQPQPDFANPYPQPPLPRTEPVVFTSGWPDDAPDLQLGTTVVWHATPQQQAALDEISKWTRQNRARTDAGMLGFAPRKPIADGVRNLDDPEIRTNRQPHAPSGAAPSAEWGADCVRRHPGKEVNRLKLGTVFGALEPAASSGHRAPVFDELEVVADANGWFMARGHWVDGFFNRTLRIRMIDADGGERVAHATLRGDLDDERLSAGRVMLRRVHLVAAGRVLDDRGRPVFGARLVVNGKSVSARTDARGEFRFESCEHPGAEVDLSILASNHARRSLRKVALGTDDLDITLPRHGRVDGRIFIDQGAKIDDLYVRLVPADVEATLLPKRMKTYKLDKIRSKRGQYRFAWRSVPPGTWHVRIGRTRTDPIYVVHDVHVEAGARNHDHRLEDIDLRGLLPKNTPVDRSALKP